MTSQYDFSHPVAVWSLWMNGVRPPSKKVVWQEITVAKTKLWEFARTGPCIVHCFHDLYENLDFRVYDIQRIGLYVIDNRRRVIQLVTLLTHNEAIRRINDLKKRCRRKDDYATLYRLNRISPFFFLCDNTMGHTLGIKAHRIDEAVLNESMRATLDHLCPPLKNLPLQWLNKDYAYELLDGINSRLTGEDYSD